MAIAPVASVPAAAPGGNYTVQPGESFYGVARKHRVKAEELAQVNGITDVAKIKQGQVLKIPGPGVVAAASAVACNTSGGIYLRSDGRGACCSSSRSPACRRPAR